MTRYHLRPALFVLLGVLLWALPSCQNKGKNPRNQLYTIKPPLKGVKVTPEEVTIDPTKAQVVKFAGGTHVEIPANAFVDEQGKLVKTPVKLALEVYDTPAKIMASGIPMTFDDGKTKGYFESAGMFQMTGKSQGQKVSIAQDKSLTVNYPSKVAGDDFDFFYFEEQAETPQVAMAQVASRKDKKQAKRTAKPVRKGRWKKLTNKTKDSTQQNRPKAVDSFRLKFKKDSFPELADLETIDWQLATSFKNPKDSNYNWVLKEQWAELELSQPQLITGNPLQIHQSNPNNAREYNRWGWSKKGKRFVLLNGGQLQIFDEKGSLVSTINGIGGTWMSFRILEDKYLLVYKSSGTYLHDLNGRQIGFYPKVKSLTFEDVMFSYKNNRAVFKPTKDDPQKDNFIVKLTDLSGKVLKTFTLKEDKRNGLDWSIPRVYAHFKLVDDKYVVTNDLSGVKVYDLDGKMITQKSGQFQQLYYYEGTEVFLEEFSGQMRQWNFMNGKELLSPQGAFDLNSKKSGNTLHSSYIWRKIHQHPLLLIEEAGQRQVSKLWNYETNQVVPLNFTSRDGYASDKKDTIAPQIIAGYHYQDQSSLYLYNVRQQKVLARIPRYHYPYTDHMRWPLTPYKNAKLQRILVNSDTVTQMLDFGGKLVFDFKQYDSTSNLIGFTDDEYIFSISKTGVYRKWGANGQLISSKTWENGYFSSGYLWDKQRIGTFARDVRNFKMYDLQGNFLLHPSRDYHYDFGNGYVMHMYFKKNPEFFFYKLQKRPVQAYQLTLRTLKKEFITYVYANDARTQQILTKYRQFRARKLAEEIGRQHQEAALVRTFRIKKFGLYNWDLLLQKGRTVFEADFDFQQATDYNDVAVFLITRSGGNVVIPFYTELWDQFSIDPKVPNRLVAVLPKNKLAVFSESQMDKIDWQQVKQTGKFKFKMRILENTVDNLDALTSTLAK